MGQPLRFRASLYDAGHGFVCLDLPKKVSTGLGSRARIPVAVEINGFSVRTSVFPTGKGTHFMLVNKSMQKGAAAGVGDRVEVLLKPDRAKRTVKVPKDLRDALAKKAKAKLNFSKLAYTHRKEYVDWIEEAKRPETRKRRIEKALEKLGKGKGEF